VKSPKKLTLKEAQKKNKLEQFIKQEEQKHDVGDEERFNKTLKSMIELQPVKSRKTKKVKKS
jgi:hypothetical protein